MSLDNFIDNLVLVTGMRQNSDFYAKKDTSLTIIGRGTVVNVSIARGEYRVSVLDGGKFIIVATEAAQKSAIWAVRALIMR